MSSTFSNREISYLFSRGIEVEVDVAMAFFGILLLFVIIVIGSLKYNENIVIASSDLFLFSPCL